MAISPDQAERLCRSGISLSDEEKAISDALEALIDARLPALYKRGRVVRPSFPRFISRSVLEELGRRYTQSGWHIDIEEPTRGSPGYRLALTARRRRFARIAQLT